MLRRFFNNFSKYVTIAIGISLVAAAIATGVGAALGAAGVFAGGAVGGMTAIWTAVGGAMATVGNAVGITSVFTGMGMASGAASIAAGASIVLSGIYGLAAAAAGIKTITEPSQAKAPANHNVSHAKSKSAHVSKEPTRSQQQEHYRQDFIKAQAKGGHADKVLQSRGQSREAKPSYANNNPSHQTRADALSARRNQEMITVGGKH